MDSSDEDRIRQLEEALNQERLLPGADLHGIEIRRQLLLRIGPKLMPHKWMMFPN